MSKEAMHGQELRARSPAGPLAMSGRAQVAVRMDREEGSPEARRQESAVPGLTGSCFLLQTPQLTGQARALPRGPCE